MNTIQEVNETLNNIPGTTESGVGKFLIFKLGAEEYGLEILKVSEIIGLMGVTKVPKTPNFIRGIINLRGKIIPAFDLRAKFGMELKKDTDETCVIVIEVALEEGTVSMGIQVDAVSEVLDINKDEIEDTPDFGGYLDANFILGIGKIKNEVKILLDIDMVLTAVDVAVAKRIIRKSTTTADGTV